MQNVASTLCLVMAVNVMAFVVNVRTIPTDLQRSIYVEVKGQPPLLSPPPPMDQMRLLSAHCLANCFSALDFNSSIILFVLNLCLLRLCCDVGRCILFLVKLCLGRHLTISDLVCSGHLFASISASAACFRVWGGWSCCFVGLFVQTVDLLLCFLDVLDCC